MNKIFLVSIMLFAFSNIYAEEQNSSDSEISIIIDKDDLMKLIKKNPSGSFVEKIFNIGGDVFCGAGMGAVLASTFLLYNQAIEINNMPSLQVGVCIIDKQKWNEKVAFAVLSGAVLGGAYGFLNGVYKNFVKN